MNRVNLAIIGGGLVGASLALALQAGAKARGWKILLIGADERYLPTDNGTLFSTGNHPVETLLPMYHLDKAGFAFEVATLSGNPVKFEWWAMPTEDEAVVGLYGKYQEQFRQPARLADLLVRALGPESDYLGVFIPGGHGALMGLPESREMKALLEDNAPYEAKVTWEGLSSSSGWNAPGMDGWFENALNAASQAHFGAGCGYIGQGGTIPLMNMLSKGFPKAQMMVCGVLGPKSNAHGPNEFLHVPYAKRLTASVAHVMAAMAQAQAAPQGAAPAAAP